MATTASSTKGKHVGPTSLKMTNPPRTGRPPSRSSLQSSLSLRTVLGTTTTTPNGFSSHDQSKTFALCAGSAAVLAELDDDGNISQRFFRARPSATSMNPVTSFYNQSTPPSTPDPRLRSLSHNRSNPHLNVNNASPHSDLSSRERVKAVTSVSISPNGRFLAVGETGYNPRVMIFSTAKDALPDAPLSILSEHTFGVCGLAFTPDSQYLATLGNANDGFLFIWSINLKNGSAKLHSTNKCTSFVRDMCWVGQALVTTGVRHVKVWRLPTVRPVSPTKTRLTLEGPPLSPNSAPRALSGRNCILGTLGGDTFSCVSSISDQEAVIATETGAVCLLDDREGAQKLTIVMHAGFGITSLAVDFDREVIWLGGRGRKMQSLSFEYLRQSTSNPPSPRLLKVATEKKSKDPATTCMGSLGSHLVTVEATKEIHIYPMDTLRDEGEQDQGETLMSAHRDPVLGLGRLPKPNDFSADFFSWSRNGSVNFWDAQGKCTISQTVPVEEHPGTDEDAANELKVIRAAEDASWFVSGDKLGVLRLHSSGPWACIKEARAHAAEITDIAISSSSDSCLVATCGRDRTVQLFQKTDESLDLIQTMDEHVGAVGQVFFMHDGERLLSSSADRTVLVRERATREEDGGTCLAYLAARVITLKASPVSITFCPDDSDTIYLSTMDRTISKYDVPSGKNLYCFKSSDPEANDAVIMSSLTVISEVPGQSPKLLVGVSSTDKSIRVYDLERDQLIAGEFGHTDGVSDSLVLEEPDESDKAITKRTLISAGLDGILMIWNLSVQPQPSPDLVQAGEDESSGVETSAKLPLRKVLSRSELAGFHRPEHPLGSPTFSRELSPTLTKKLSKLSLTSSSLKNQPHTGTPSPNRLSPTSYAHERGGRSPSPGAVSPKWKPHLPRKHSSSRNLNRRASQDYRSRGTRHEHGGLESSSEQLCRTLRTYRKKLVGSSEQLHAHKELERELSLTLRAVNAHILSDESPETETDSSGKDIERKPSYSSISSRSPRPHRVPSTPSLRHTSLRGHLRTPSYDGNSEQS
ncbi:hypothetical protein N7495_000087 [Penicillium taxi]|uniref:uncharacterized protein n=1 Tax=Penicillium taxi TaxID=168475 RepID=UPI0025452CF3|nr:uncharacterized protein N7495_000087 [Penicillium taxi]KAJ5907405.1 hypothetical protein N7495_000087 [Penicillium taxi]